MYKTLSDSVLQMIQSPGSFKYICAMNGFPPFLCHQPHGTIVHTVTEAEHAAMLLRAHI
jgi:hypothetical protein